MLDLYFRRPVLWDYFVAMILAFIGKILLCRKILSLPKDDHLFSIVSDLSTIALTLAGFVLTLLTVLISYKSAVKKMSSEERPKESDNSYDLFFSTGLYFETVNHLKNAIKSIVLVAVVGYLLKLTLSPISYDGLFVYSILGIAVIVFTLWRCILILTKIIALQQEN